MKQIIGSRKIRRVNSTFFVSLPHQWCKLNSIKEGTKVQLFPSGDKLLLEFDEGD